MGSVIVGDVVAAVAPKGRGPASRHHYLIEIDAGYGAYRNRTAIRIDLVAVSAELAVPKKLRR